MASALRFQKIKRNAMNALVKPDAALVGKEFSQVSNDEIKAGLMGRFGSLSHFCRLSTPARKLPELNQNLRYRTERSTPYLERVWKDAKRLANVKVEGYHLTEEARKSLSTKLSGFGSIRAFCEAHSEFSNVFVSRTINGRTGKITPKIRKLATALKVELKFYQPIQ